MFKVAAPIKLPKYVKYILILVPFVEIALFILVGMTIGLLATIGLIIATTLLGFAILKRQGAAAIMAQQSRTTKNAPDVMLMSINMMISFLLILPGFLTDAVALVCLIPPIRQKIADYYMKQSLNAYHKTAQAHHGFQTQHQHTKASNDPKVIEGEFWQEGQEDDDKS